MIGWLADSLYSGIIGCWWHMQLLPWPTWSELFKSLVVFTCLWKPRQVLERYWLSKPLYKRRGRSFPTTKDHQTAVSAIDDLFSH